MKLTKYILSFAAAAGILAGCQTPEIVQIAAPEDVVPAVLHELELDEIAITANNQQETVTFSWDAADYGAATSVRYSVEASLSEDGKKVEIASGLGKTEAKVTYEDLNRVLFNDLEVPEGKATELKVYIGSIIYSGAVTASYPKVYSEPKSLTVTVTAAEKVYPMVYVIGDFNGWKDGTTQELFEFTPASGKYSGMLGFGGKAANGWKIKGTAEGWDDTCNWGLDGDKETPAAEAPELTLITSGGSKDIKIYSKNFYNVTFDKTALTLKVNLSFDQIGVIGSFNDWGADVVMKFDDVKQKFYADVEFAADAEFKFRLDGAWTISYGTGADGFLTSDNGGNISAKAGNYRVYLNMNNLGEITYELNKGDYGASTPEPEPEPEPDPTPVVGWSLIGAFNSWAGDHMLASDGTYLVAKGVALEGEFKFRKDGDWAVNFGAAEGAAFAANTEIALAQGGANLVAVAGTYDVYLDEANAKAWFITDGSYPGGGAAPEASEWGVVGVVNSWGGSPDVVMYKTATEGLFVAYNVPMPDGGFKIRANNAWVDTANYGLAAAGSVEVDHVYDLVCAGSSGDMTLVAGNYDIWFDLTNSKVYIMTPGKPISEAVGGEVVTPPTPPTPEDAVWGVVGTITGWADNADINMVEEGDWFVAKGVALTTTDEFKFRTNGTWGTERTATTTDPVAINTEYEAAAGSGNIKVAVDGTFDLYLAKTLDKFYVMTAGLTPGQTPGEEPKPEEPDFEAVESIYGVIGVNNDWTNDIMMYTTPVEDLFVARNVVFTADGGFKVRMAGAWDDTANFGLENGKAAVVVDHVYNVITSGGSGDLLVTAGAYDIWFDFKNMKIYVMTPGKDISEATPGEGVVPEPVEGEPWYLVGKFNDWTPADANYKMTFDGTWYVFKNFAADGQGMKFVGDSNWSRERVGTFKSANTAISVAKGSGDMFPAAGTYDVYLSADAKTAYFMTPGTTPAN